MCSDATVFLVEDDAAVRDALSISLSMAGLKLEAYACGASFLNAYDGDRPGCLLMQLNHPEMHGLAVQQELAKFYYKIPVIFMAGFGTLGHSMSAMHAGAFACLEKPIPRQLLLQLVHEAIEQDCRNRMVKKTKLPAGKKDWRDHLITRMQISWCDKALSSGEDWLLNPIG